MFAVVKNVPIPDKVMPRNTRESKYPFATMDVGDAFFVPKDKNTLATHASVVGRRLGRKFTTRMVDKDGVSCIGVWRTK